MPSVQKWAEGILLNMCMIYVDQLHNFDRSIYELQELLLFCVTTPSYTNIQMMQNHADKIDLFLYTLGASDTRLPFDCILRLWGSDLNWRLKVNKIPYTIRSSDRMVEASTIPSIILQNGDLDTILSYFSSYASPSVRMFMNFTRGHCHYPIITNSLIDIVKKNGYWCPKRIRTETDYQNVEQALGKCI